MQFFFLSFVKKNFVKFFQHFSCPLIFGKFVIISYMYNCIAIIINKLRILNRHAYAFVIFKAYFVKSGVFTFHFFFLYLNPRIEYIKNNLFSHLRVFSKLS